MSAPYTFDFHKSDSRKMHLTWVYNELCRKGFVWRCFTSSWTNTGETSPKIRIIKRISFKSSSRHVAISLWCSGRKAKAFHLQNFDQMIRWIFSFWYILYVTYIILIIFERLFKTWEWIIDCKDWKWSGWRVQRTWNGIRRCWVYVFKKINWKSFSYSVIHCILTIEIHWIIV